MNIRLKLQSISRLLLVTAWICLSITVATQSAWAQGGSIIPRFSGPCFSSVQQPRPPGLGFGSQRYKYKVTERTLSYGPQNRRQNRIFQFIPNPKTEQKRPVVVYLPGYAAGTVGVQLYREFLRHLAQKGFPVSYITYGSMRDQSQYESNAIKGIRQALASWDHLISQAEANADTSGIILVGHSLGSVLNYRIAHRSFALNLPEVLALIAHDAEGAEVPEIASRIPLTDLSGIGADTKLFWLSAPSSLSESPYLASNQTVALQYHNTTNVPKDRKFFMVIPSDDHGCPQMVSDHYGVFSGLGWTEDAIDWWGYRRFTEAAIAWISGDDEAGVYFDGKSNEGFYMGRWSDLQLARRMIWHLPVAPLKP